MRRPLCIGLLLLLTLYLTAIAVQGRAPEGSRRASRAAGMQVGDLQEGWETLAGEEVLLRGKVQQLYEPADGSQEKMSFILQEVGVLSDTLQNSGGALPQTIINEKLGKYGKRILCYVDVGQNLPNTGSCVQVRGFLTPFSPASNPGEFDAAVYYTGQDCVFSLRKARVVAESREYDRLAQGMYQLRCRIGRFFIQLFGEKDGEVAAAMVLGIKKGLDSQIKALYDGAALSHTLVVSGLHCSIIGMGIFALLRKCRLPLLPAALIAMTLLILYGQMTGMGVSTLRAILMFVLLLTAKLVRRTADIPTSLTVAACVILFPHPEKLQDAGFLLSFSAVAGVAMLVPVLQDEGIQAQNRNRSGLFGRAGGLPPEIRKVLGQIGRGCFQGVTASLGITLAMLPFLLSSYYKWNPWSILANLVVIPLMSVLLPMLILLAGMGILLEKVPGIWLFLKVLALPAKFIFFLYEKIAELVLWLPGSSLHTGMPSGWQFAAFGAGLLLLLNWGRKIPPLPRNLLACLLSGIFLLRLPGQLQITMLDVGQGECICFETPEHHIWLLDAGSSSESRAGQYQIVPFLRYRGVRRLEGILVSHWDDDHINALEDIFEWARAEQVEIGGLFLPDIREIGGKNTAFDKASEADEQAMPDENLTALLELTEAYGIRSMRVHAGQMLQDGKVTLRCLYPSAGEAVADRNSSSSVFRLEYGNFSALFTGDLQEEQERWLIETFGKNSGGILDCELLDAGHHGAANASTQELLEAVSPRVVLISCGLNNRYGHPARQTLERLEKEGIPYYVTAQQGAVTVRVRKDGMEISAYLR